jgi:integrase
MTDIYRILTPSEYKALLAAIPKLDNRIRVETMMNTGMRYSELQEFGHNLGWFHPRDRCIVIPGASLKQGKNEKTIIDKLKGRKTKRKLITRDRTVHLTPAFSEKLEMYLSSHKLTFPDRSTMKKNLRRWYLTAYSVKEAVFALRWYPLPKTFRKTWETWLIFVGYDSLKVAVSQGHTQTVQIAHYQNMMGSLKNEVEAVKELTRGWMT